MSVNNANPGNLFGGNWEQIEDAYLYAKMSSETAGNIYGSTDYKISDNQLPKHSHSYSGTTSLNGSHYHGVPYDSVNGGEDYEQDLFPQRYMHRNGYINTTTVGDHSHTFSGITGDGGFVNEEYKPKYISLYVWKRIP